MHNKAIKPYDILSDSESFVELNGVTVRKGSVAAFLKNIDLFEDDNSNDSQKSDAMEMIKELSPAIIATGLYKHVIFKNKAIQDILTNTAILLQK